MSYPAYSNHPYTNQYPQQGPYPAGQYYPHYPQQPQVVYEDRRPKTGDATNWLTALLAFCGGCLLGQACDDCGGPDCCFCCLPIPLPRMR
ncbi:hypothetical protein DdX_18883 [Ditylenchus destructor]|uniref:Uncharacterized protein n=1 Tax=Ditylenchus destructor TaxID=166010 RepID=A0AAD4QXW0_9BILA|nr:hypothetical protein DdX_18883 [Ditylenchus destructor]